MKKVLMALACTAVILTGCTSPQEVETLPEVTLSKLTPQGDTVPERTELSELRGPLVVNLFASWCAPCRKEIPVINEFYETYGNDVDVLGIDHKDPRRDKLRELLVATEPSYPLLDDSLGELDAAPPFPPTRGLPFWAFVDAEGVVTHVEFKEYTSVEQLRSSVTEHLEVQL